MSATIIDGKKIASEILDQLKKDVNDLNDKTGLVPGLRVIIVGENPASKVYVSHKDKKAKSLGVNSEIIYCDENIKEIDLIKLIEQYNNDEDINGILVQLPLPNHINKTKIINSISEEKDVDGFHIVSTGNLYTYQDCLIPCTPQGCMILLDSINIDLTGLNAVIIGRSNIVGKPMAELLLQANATPTIIHSKTKNMEFYTKNADLIIAAVGIPNILNKSNVKKDAIIIDVGINRIELDNGKSRLVGDADFEDLKEHVSYITPVPGGVGPMTVACLMRNTIKSFKKKNNL